MSGYYPNATTTITSSLPACPAFSTECIPCYFAASSTSLTFPYSLTTLTVDITPHVTRYSNGTNVTSFETNTAFVLGSNSTTTTVTTSLSQPTNVSAGSAISTPIFGHDDVLTWVQNGATLTSGTTYLQYTAFSGAGPQSNPPVFPSRTSVATCAQYASIARLQLPSTVQNASLIVPLPTGEVGGFVPAQVLDYVGNLSTVAQQLGNSHLSSCSSPRAPSTYAVPCVSVFSTTYRSVASFKATQPTTNSTVVSQVITTVFYSPPSTLAESTSAASATYATQSPVATHQTAISLTSITRSTQYSDVSVPATPTSQSPPVVPITTSPGQNPTTIPPGSQSNPNNQDSQNSAGQNTGSNTALPDQSPGSNQGSGQNTAGASGGDNPSPGSGQTTPGSPHGENPPAGSGPTNCAPGAIAVLCSALTSASNSPGGSPLNGAPGAVQGSGNGAGAWTDAGSTYSSLPSGLGVQAIGNGQTTTLSPFITGYMIGSQTASPGGSAVTSDGTTYSALPSGGVQVAANGFTSTITPAPISPAGSLPGPTQVIAAGGVTGYVVGDVTVTPGGAPYTTESTTYWALSSGSGLVEANSGQTKTLSTPPNSNYPTAVTLGNGVVVTVGGSAITSDGTTYSALASASGGVQVVANGQTSISYPALITPTLLPAPGLGGYIASGLGSSTGRSMVASTTTSPRSGQSSSVSPSVPTSRTGSSGSPGTPRIGSASRVSAVLLALAMWL